MWAIAGVLLGVVLVASLLGFHLGPHLHAAAGAIGVVAAAWLIVMAVSGQSAPLLWVLFGADLAVSGGVGVLAWKALKDRHEPGMLQPTRLEGELGVAEGALEPEGIVRVNGESWSATSLNGDLPAGAQVQVINAEGVRLEVWGVDVIAPDPEPLPAPRGAQSSDEPTDDDRRAGS